MVQVLNGTEIIISVPAHFLTPAQVREAARRGWTVNYLGV